MEEVLGTEAVKRFCICNAFKYLYRCQRKNGIEDVRKAEWYLKKIYRIVGKRQTFEVFKWKRRIE